MPNALIRNPVTNWTGAIQPSEFETLEQRVASAINGDDGSAHAPTSTITITGGALVPLLVLGPVVANRAAGQIVANCTATTGGDATIQLQDGDWVELEEGNPFATHVVANETACGRGIPSYHWVTRPDGALQAYGPGYDLDDGNGAQVARAYVPVRAHDASTLAQVTVYFRVGAAHATVPTTPPAIRVLRQDQNGNCVALTSTAAGADSDGYVTMPKPSSGAVWYASGASQSFTVPCDQNNAVDVSQYAYFVELVEEQGLTGFPWVTVYKSPVDAVIDQSKNVSFTATADNAPVATGSRVLIIESIGPASDILGLATYGTNGEFEAANLPVRINSTSYAIGDLLVDWSSQLYYLVCIQAGTSAGSAPAWPSTVYRGLTIIADGTAVWRVAGFTGPVSSPASDMASPNDWTPGMVVRTRSSGVDYGSVDMQANPNIPTWPGPSVFVPGYVPAVPLFAPRFASSAIGVIWDSVEATFEDIGDLRPQ